MNHSKISVWAMLGFGLAFTLSSCNSQENKTEIPAVSVNSEKEIIQRGEYLVTTMGCNDCHSPKKMGPKGPEIIPELLLSGYPSDRPIVKFDSPLIKQGFAQLYPDLTAAAGPWGVSFAANLTPDETGIGNWTEDQFKMALTKGKYKGLEHERMLLPPMPWFNFVNLKDEDAHAMFQYLKSLKPVKNTVPMPITPDKM
ncbi:c-type cytochrome [Aquirufa salirivi]|uniref:C-type cytochrome n=1 Tax=Aquirufa salirivi TaxID=3104729 RepID=A0ABW8RW37_9BACT